MTARETLENVPVVTSAKVDFAGKRTQVVFAPNRASVDALTNAAAEVGYPAYLRRVQ